MFEQPAPTSESNLVALRVHGLKLWIPANYIQFDSVRQGGARKDVAPAMIPGVPAGDHVIEVRKAPGLPWKQTVEVKASHWAVSLPNPREDLQKLVAG